MPFKYYLILLLCCSVNKAYYDCPSDTLAVYEVHLETLWRRRDFPKHYPEWRPQASWSKMLGFSHNSSFHAFHIGQKASQELKKFVETARTDLFDLNTQGYMGIFDRYSTPPIRSGTGETKVLFIADSNHSKVSMICKIMPSPDWFIGVDSYDLCSDGRWLQYIHLEVGPLDAGTDNGLTFTSPNWPTKPQEKIEPITAMHSNHPAGAFYYPEIESLPPVAQFAIKKLSEYALRNGFDAADFPVGDRNDIYRYEVADQNHRGPSDRKMYQDQESDFYNLHSPHSYQNRNHLRNNKEKSVILDTSKRQDLLQVTKPEFAEKDEMSVIRESRSDAPVQMAKGYETNSDSGNKHGRKRIIGGDVMSVIDDIVKDYQKEHRRMIRKHKKGRLLRRQRMKKIKPPRDCRVSVWSIWSSCSKTCGIGERSRTRNVTKHARRGGTSCPVLVETTWCGSSRACKRDDFS